MIPKVKFLSIAMTVMLLLSTQILVADEAAKAKALVEQGVVMAVTKG